MQKQYTFKIDADEKQLELLKTYLGSKLKLPYRFEEIKDNNIVINNLDKTIAFYYTNGYSDNCVLLNNIIDIDRFIEVYPTITPMYSFNIENDFMLLNNYVGKELTEEIIVYCKRLYNDKLNKN